MLTMTIRIGLLCQGPPNHACSSSTNVSQAEELPELVSGPWEQFKNSPRGPYKGKDADKPNWSVEDIHQALAAELSIDVLRVCDFFSLTRNRSAPKNAGYAFLSFRNRALMEHFAKGTVVGVSNEQGHSFRLSSTLPSFRHHEHTPTLPSFLVLHENTPILYCLFVL